MAIQACSADERRETSSARNYAGALRNGGRTTEGSFVYGPSGPDCGPVDLLYVKEAEAEVMGENVCYRLRVERLGETQEHPEPREGSVLSLSGSLTNNRCMNGVIFNKSGNDRGPIGEMRLPPEENPMGLLPGITYFIDFFPEGTEGV